MFRDLRRRYKWILPTFYYTDKKHLITSLKEEVIDQAEAKANEREQDSAYLDEVYLDEIYLDQVYLKWNFEE